MKADYIVYTDGGSRGNPGVAGAGAVVKNSADQIIRGVAVPLGINTNNFAEYRAVVEGFNLLKKLVKKEDRKKVNILFRMDSELIVKQLTGIYQIKEESLFPHFIEIHNIQVSDFPNVEFEHVRREYNKDADALANQAMDEQG